MKIIITESQFKLLVSEQKNPLISGAASVFPKNKTEYNKLDAKQQLFFCKAKYNEDFFNNAKKWWIDALNNPNMILKILNSLYGVNNVKSMSKPVMQEYSKKIMEIRSKAIERIKSAKMQYEFSNSGSLAWVMKQWSRGLPFTFDVTQNIVYVNCNNIFVEDRYESVLTHELSHIISTLIDDTYGKKTFDTQHKTQPIKGYIKIGDKYFWDKPSYSTYKLPKPGQSEPEISPIRSILNRAIEGTINQSDVPKVNETGYACNRDEVFARTAEFKKSMRLSVQEDITIEMLREVDDKVLEPFLLNIACYAYRKDDMTFQEYLDEINKLPIKP